MGSRPAIFIADRSLAHQALVQNGALFADRPQPFPIIKVISSNQHNISSAFYGPTWRLLRRNLNKEILHPSRVKSYAHARKWVLQILRNRIESQAKSGHPLSVLDHFQFSMFALLVLMCFGDRFDENQIKQIEGVQQDILLCYHKFNILNFWPTLTKIFMRRRWEEFFQIRQRQKDVLIPLIRARKKLKEEKINKAKEGKKEHQDEYVLSYADTLLELVLPDEKRKLDEDELVSLCSEFLNAGTDTTSTVLQWIMANLVKYPQIQEKGLRRHPPGHSVLTHAVTEDTVLDKYVIPKNGIINFMIAEMAWDPKVWEDPMSFEPERFLNSGGEAFDITGSREIKMMPFGVGRRICPAYGLAMLHLEYFVANLVWNFEWKAMEGDDVDLSEKLEFTVVMKNPLQAQIFPRLK
ncbi:hypothetical protein GH714_004263 [Hevea brasiliensis]|uniref:Cytochrome P450 n=1 Tax=Hevea brasiliensis TaxID=3981 RepID=A0A6A6KGN0_HEVBR|nr:hypothetical protein GH714_004263 [Hevea brasiliensis]